MENDRLEATARVVAGVADRRDAVRSLGMLGLGALAARGLAGQGPSADGILEAEAKSKKKKKSKKPKPGPAGAAGPTGPTGPTGATGATGAIEAASTTEVFQNAQLANTLFATEVVTPRCPNVNSKVLGGGFDCAVSGALSGEVTVNAAFPTERNGNTPEGFQVEFTRTGVLVSSPIVVTAFVKCTV